MPSVTPGPEWKVGTESGVLGIATGWDSQGGRDTQDCLSFCCLESPVCHMRSSSMPLLSVRTLGQSCELESSPLRPLSSMHPIGALWRVPLPPSACPIQPVIWATGACTACPASLPQGSFWLPSPNKVLIHTSASEKPPDLCDSGYLSSQHCASRNPWAGYGSQLHLLRPLPSRALAQHPLYSREGGTCFTGCVCVCVHLNARADFRTSSPNYTHHVNTGSFVLVGRV